MGVWLRFLSNGTRVFKELRYGRNGVGRCVVLHFVGDCSVEAKQKIGKRRNRFPMSLGSFEIVFFWPRTNFRSGVFFDGEQETQTKQAS